MSDIPPDPMSLTGHLSDIAPVFGGGYMVTRECWESADRDALLDMIVSSAKRNARAYGHTVVEDGWQAGPNELDLLEQRPLIYVFVAGPIEPKGGASDVE